MEKLSFSLLTPNEKSAYKLLEEVMVNRRVSCDISRLGRGVDISRIVSAILSDHPEIIYFNRTTMRKDVSLFSKHLTFTRIGTPREEKERSDRLSKCLEDAVFEIDKNARTDFDILRGISEFLQRTVKYDDIELNSKTYWNGSKRPDSHNAYGALVNHLAVCDGFSSAFALIANEFGFRNMLVEGKSMHQTSNNVDHAWNIVEYEGAFYHLDVTWDHSSYETMHTYPYFFFGLTDDEISVDHQWDFRKTPKCSDNKLSFYIHNKLVAFSEDQIKAIALREIKLGKKTIRIKVDVGVPVPNDGGSHIAELVIDQGVKVFGRVGINYLWNESSRCFVGAIS